MSEPITNVEDAVRELGALPMPAGSALDDARRAASEMLRKTTGVDLPEWRVTYTEYGVHDEANAIAPVCTDPDHVASEDPTAFECCPEPIIGVGPGLAEYLVALLNADRAAAGGAS